MITNNGTVKTMEIEKSTVDLIQKICSNRLEIVKTRECCECDLLIRPINSKIDLWLKIQLKSSETQNYLCFKTVKSNGEKYKDIILLLAHVTNKKFWITESNDVDVSQITFGKKKSKYDKHEVKQENLVNELLIWYNKNIYNTTFEKENTPQAKKGSNRV